MWYQARVVVAGLLTRDLATVRRGAALFMALAQLEQVRWRRRLGW